MFSQPIKLKILKVWTKDKWLVQNTNLNISKIIQHLQTFLDRFQTSCFVNTINLKLMVKIWFILLKQKSPTSMKNPEYWSFKNNVIKKEQNLEPQELCPFSFLNASAYTWINLSILIQDWITFALLTHSCINKLLESINHAIEDQQNFLLGRTKNCIPYFTRASCKMDCILHLNEHVQPHV